MSDETAIRPIDAKDLGRRIYNLRSVRGMTQEELAAKIGKSPASVGHIERGMRLPSLEVLLALAAIFEVSLDYLLEKSLPPREADDLLNPSQKLALKAMRAAFWPIPPEEFARELEGYGMEKPENEEMEETEDPQD